MRPLALTLALTAALSTARAADLTVYYSFAEVRDPVSVQAPAFEWSPGTDAYNQIVPGSLELEFPGVTGRLALAASDNLLQAFEGKEVLVKRGTDTVRARLVSAQHMLFEANGQYFQSDAASVTFPNLDGVRLAPAYRWSLTGSGNATLSYLTRAITWQPRYTLAVENNAATLAAWADVNNSTLNTFNAPKLTLLAGQANLMSEPYYDARGGVAMAAPAPMTAESKVVASGETAGLQSFTYPSAVTLPPRSITSVRFVQPKVKLERILQYSGGFSTRDRQQVPLARLYNITPDADLPAGTVTVREDGKVVGQAVTPDTPKNEEASLNLGQDFDIRMTRTVTSLEQTKTQARFKVGFSLVNTKARPITVKLRETIGGYYGRSFELSSVVLPNYKPDATGFNATANLAPGARLEASYVVTFKLQ